MKGLPLKVLPTLKPNINIFFSIPYSLSIILFIWTRSVEEVSFNRSAQFIPQLLINISNLHLHRSCTLNQSIKWSANT